MDISAFVIQAEKSPAEIINGFLHSESGSQSTYEKVKQNSVSVN